LSRKKPFVSAALSGLIGYERFLAFPAGPRSLDLFATEIYQAGGKEEDETAELRDPNE